MKKARFHLRLPAFRPQFPAGGAEVRKAGGKLAMLVGSAVLAGCATQSPTTTQNGSSAAADTPANHPIPSWKDSISPLPSRTEPLDPEKILSGQWQDDKADAGVGGQAELAAYALNYLGVRYRLGGSSPEAGFDCSGLVTYVSREVLGLQLPRRAEEISRVGDPIDIGDLRPGDLVFYNTLRRKFSHVGIYLGDGRFVHSPSSGGVVRVESMDIAYWKKRFNGARRLASSESASR